jgi:CheY-like chemotaxis protein
MARILVVDDEISVRLTIQTILKRRGYDVILESCGRTALQTELCSFDTIIVDIFMPEMNGIETIKAIKEVAPDVPIIAISGHSFRDTQNAVPNFLRMSLALGATACLQKPFKAWELIKAVEACCGFEPTEQSLDEQEIAAAADGSNPRGSPVEVPRNDHETSQQ